MRTRSSLAVVLVSSVMAACGGTASHAPIPPVTGTSSGQRATASLTVHWIATSTAAVGRRPKTISPSAASIVSSVNGNVVDITNRYGAPSSQITLDAPVGTDAFTFKIYDQTGGAGNLLGQSSVTKTIVVGALNAISTAIEAVCARTVVTGATSPAHEYVTYTYAPQPAGQLGQTSISALEIVGAGEGELFVAAADADGNLILAPGGTPVMSAGFPAAIYVTAVPDPTHLIFAGYRTARNTSLIANVAAPGCPAASFLASTSSAFYVSEGSALFVFDRYGTSFASTTTMPGTLVGTNGANPVFYDPATGNVTETNPDFSTPQVRFTARSGATLFAYDAYRHALISVVSGATSIVYVDYKTGLPKQVSVAANVTTVTAAVGAEYYYAGDGSKIFEIDPTAVTIATSVTNPYAFGLLADTGANELFALNTGSPYTTIYAGGAFPSGYGSNNQGFTAPVTRALVMDMEDFSLVGVTAGGTIQHTVSGNTLLPSGSSLTGLFVVNQIAVSYPTEAAL
jgi:hypothetical protein